MDEYEYTFTDDELAELENEFANGITREMVRGIYDVEQWNALVKRYVASLDNSPEMRREHAQLTICDPIADELRDAFLRIDPSLDENPVFEENINFIKGLIYRGWDNLQLPEGEREPMNMVDFDEFTE
ncbi:hypothetical protein NDN17_19500 [Shewanella algae]|uniref:hypothetical protein n=1 Tax=Shewanella algae TaxID=38313 RepID=UPI002034D22F|nr:hypothetical protein [Shewanella algae]MCM2530681.1 hypothetical protein [Shewanella algae]